jgi:hypothetical protein
MHLTVPPLLLSLALSLTAPSLAERPYFCPLSLDVHMMQYPFCCEGFVPARDSKVSMEGVNCMFCLSWKLVWEGGKLMRLFWQVLILARMRTLLGIVQRVGRRSAVILL